MIQKKGKRRKKQINPYMKAGEQGNELTTPDLFCACFGILLAYTDIISLTPNIRFANEEIFSVLLKSNFRLRKRNVEIILLICDRARI